MLALHNYNEDVDILFSAMHALYRFGSIEKFVLSVVEYDAPGRVIFALSQHMVCHLSFPRCTYHTFIPRYMYRLCLRCLRSSVFLRDIVQFDRLMFPVLGACSFFLARRRSSPTPQDMAKLLVDGITLLGNLATNDHIKALIRMQKGIELIASIMQTYETHPSADSRAVLDRCCYALNHLAWQSADNVTQIVQPQDASQIGARLCESGIERGKFCNELVLVVGVMMSDTRKFVWRISSVHIA